MPYHDSPSPARRPPLTERTSSTQSSSRGSPTTTSASKASSQKPHKAHAVGHHRHSHGRIPSYNKNLNKMSKLTAIHPANPPTQSKNTTSTKSQSPPSSPTSQHVKRNSSNISLLKTGSKVSFKKNSSNGSLKRDGSTAKLSHPAKSHARPDSRHGSSHNPPLRPKAHFSMGSDDDEDDDAWVEASSSQSPSTTRQSPNNSKTSRLEEPPSPDEPAGRSPPVLPHSPPPSPPTNVSNLPHLQPAEGRPDISAQYSHPPDAEIVTHRLLNRHKLHNVPPQMSTVSATSTLLGSNGSPGLHSVNESTLTNDPSMPADGISRFLHPTGSSSGSATPGSIFQLQSTLAANNHRNLLHQHPLSPSSSSPPVRGTLEPSRRAKSVGNFAQPRLPGGERHSTSPPSTPVPKNTRASPFKSAGDPREAPSLTQLKLDLQRMSTHREPAHAPAVQPPLVKHGAHVAISGERSEERRTRQWEQAGLEFRNCRRFNNMVASGVGRLVKRREKVKVPARAEREETRNTGDERNGAAGRVPASRPASRGRVRFEIGRREGEEDEDEEDDGGGLPGLLKRMWESKAPEMAD
ncbi:hypothetical protein MMC07_000228 [Pseudocyphellaria aurata]|nr:hypothetical protein [Pseudocyphellaria aurata]